MALSRTELILDRAHNAVISMDEQGLATYWNPKAETWFGISREEALGRAVADLIIPERFRKSHFAGLRRFLAEGEGPMIDRRVELAALGPDGKEFPVEMTITAFRNRGEWTFTAFIQDISERRESERERERLVRALRQALVGSERRFDAVVGSLADPVTIRDRENRIAYANRAALEHLGFESLEALRATPPDQIMAKYVVVGEDGSEISMDEIPSVRLLRGESPGPLLIRTTDRESGAERWNLLKASPLVDDSGEVEATIMVIEDVTEQKRAERRATFLAQASEVLASSLDYEQTLRNVAQLAVPDIVDGCAVDLFDGDGDRISVAVAHADPARIKLAEELRAYEPEQLDPEQGLGLVLRTGQTLTYPEIPDEMLVQSAVDDDHLELLRKVGLCSAVVVPMRIGNRTLGAMTLVSAESGRVLDRGDIELAEQIAGRAAVAIENSRVYGVRSRIAHTLQQSLLPEQLPDVPGYELASAYIPAFEGTEVGGDFYDVWETAGGWMVAIGDVAGKGAEAAALTSLIRHTLRATSEFISSPAQLLARLDSALKKHGARSICTALCVRLEQDVMTLAVGGHLLPISVNSRGAQLVGRYGSLLGAFDEVEWNDMAVEFSPETTLVMYTDGVTDAVGSGGERYGTRRLRAMLDRCQQLSAPQVVAALTTALEKFQVGEHSDDTAILAVRRLAPGHPGKRLREGSAADQTEALVTLP